MAFNPVNTSSVNALSSAASLVGSLSNLLLASPQTTQGYVPQNANTPTGLLSLFSPPPGILFNYEGEQSISIESDITDHYIEDNYALQDQIALKPVIVSTHGFVGELNNVPPPALALLQESTNTLTTLGAYNPQLAIAAQEAYDSAFASYQLAQSATNAAVSGVNSISNLVNKTSSSPPLNQQQAYFSQLYGYWRSRTLFTIQTPWGIVQDMAILSMRPIQSADDRMTTDFEVTFKQIQVASTALTGTVLQTQGQLSSQSASLTNNGTVAANPSISVSQGIAQQKAGP